MATLVLTTAGTLLGGPIGGAIGAVLGNQIDRRVLAPKGRQGPRLGDLNVQTSSYGTAIPKLFGTMRVAGTVIWATDLREDTHSSGGGKAGGRTTSYSYSASFAVALSARPILSVGRIWADGKLLRGAAGDWKSETGFRLYLGDEGQAVDPLIASAEGIGVAPAHRGIAYALFEDMQLADFGNRIPSLTFEITADEGPVPVVTIVETLSGGMIIGDAETSATIGGYAASGDSIRGAIEALAAAYPMSIGDDGGALTIDPVETVAIDPALLGAGVAQAQPRLTRQHAAADTLPDTVEISYYEPARDYQAGLQRARRDGIGARIDRIELPAALDAAEARARADMALRRAWLRREGLKLTLPWRAIEARPGLSAMIDGETWRIVEWGVERMAVSLTLARDVAAPLPVATATAGRSIGDDDRPQGATLLVPLDLPPLWDTPDTVPRIAVAAAGTQPGWRRAELSLSLDEGGSWRSVGRSALPATIGSAVSALPGGTAALFDTVGTVDVMLAHDGMSLGGADDAALLAGASLAMIGDELIQFGSAALLGPSTYRLSRLLRGRRGSEWAMDTHAIGDRFVRIDAATLTMVDMPLAAIGTTATFGAIGPGDAGAMATADVAIGARALRPPAPTDLRAERLADGTIRIGWTRRSRSGWAWLDNGDAPLGEDAERYRLVATLSGGRARSVELGALGWDYSLADQALDGATAPGAVTVSVVQLGTYAASLPPVTATLTL